MRLTCRPSNSDAPPASDGAAAGRAPDGVEITEANLEAEVLVRSSQVPVVVLLWSPRSEASAQLGDVLAQLAAADGGKWSLATVNVDAVPRVAQMFGVQAVPTVVALAAGQPLSSFQGVQPPEQLRAMGRLAAERDGGQARRRRRRGARAGRSPNSRRPARIWTPATSMPR